MQEQHGYRREQQLRNEVVDNESRNRRNQREEYLNILPVVHELFHAQASFVAGSL